MAKCEDCGGEYEIRGLDIFDKCDSCLIKLLENDNK